MPNLLKCFSLGQNKWKFQVSFKKIALKKPRGEGDIIINFA